ncbi:MAG: hypothetical protein ABIW47_14635 [Ginsengibacter sp.]
MKFIKTILSFFVATLLLFGCAKEYSVESNGKLLSAGNWEFKDSTREYMGNIDTAYITDAVSIKQLSLIGKSNDGTEGWSLRLYADTFKVGSYKASLFQSSMKYTGGGKTIYDVNQVSGEFTVMITVINGTLLTGTFSGTARDSLNGLKKIFAGKFKSIFKKPILEPESVGVLGTTAGNCDSVIINGQYKQGITVLPANTVEIKVIVAKPGTYNIYTNTVNGISFSKRGTFTSAGVQSVTLNAYGTPAFPGEQMFTLHYGNNQCAFKVTFLQGVSASNDYYPLTTNTNWTYSDLVISLKNKVTGDKKTVNGLEFNIVGTYKPPTATTYDTSLVRKLNGNYYGFGNHGAMLNLDEPVYGEFIFLKDNVPVGNSWNSDIFNGKLAGYPVTFYYKFTILSKGVAEQVGGFDFTDIIKVKQEVFINTSLVTTVETWYAKNVGPVLITVAGKPFQISGFQVF